jgi:outer membrane biosynthesis protein TonB
VRPLPALPGSSRAAAFSVAGHGALFALLTLIGARGSSPPAEAPLVFAELIAPLEPASPPPAAGPPEPEAPLEPGPEQPELPPPPTTVAEAVAPVPPRTERVDPDVEPPAKPEREPPAALDDPAPSPVERVADVPAQEAAPALDPVEPAAATDAEPAPAVAAEAPSPPAPTRALESREQRAVERRLSSWTGRFEPGQTAATLAWRDAGQEYTAVLTRVPSADPMGMDQLLVEVATERDGEHLVAELRMNRLAFSNFAQFIDRWDPEVHIHDDRIDGRFHSNSEIRVSRERGVEPVFTGKVTLAAADVRTDGSFLNRRRMFPAGIETRVRRIGLPPRAAAFEDGAVPADRVLRLAQASLITFHADGTYAVAALAGDGAAALDADTTPAGQALGEEPFYFVAGDDVEVHVRGTVNGKVLVYSRGSIVIVDDLRYASDPRTPGADDYLGLVAERTVEIAGPEVTGPGDLEVQASIYARSRFAVRNYRSRRSGTLIVYGSVTAGTVSATEPRYATRIEFDERLTTIRAPGFPLSDRYELDSASGEWRVVDAH